MIVVCSEQLRWMFRLSESGSLFWIEPSKYHPDLAGKEAGAPSVKHSGKVYWSVQIDGRKVKRSHIVFCLTHGRWPLYQVDHINGNSLDDRPANLREATLIQNAWNHKTRRKASAVPMGVRKWSDTRYQARIAVNKKQISLGSFRTASEASLAYQRARAEHFGEWA